LAVFAIAAALTAFSAALAIDPHRDRIGDTVARLTKELAGNPA